MNPTKKNTRVREVCDIFSSSINSTQSRQQHQQLTYPINRREKNIFNTSIRPYISYVCYVRHEPKSRKVHHASRVDPDSYTAVVARGVADVYP